MKTQFIPRRPGWHFARLPDFVPAFSLTDQKVLISSLCLCLLGIPTPVGGRDLLGRDQDFILMVVLVLMGGFLSLAVIRFLVKMVEMAGRLIKAVVQVSIVGFLLTVFTDAEGMAFFFRSIFDWAIFLFEWLRSIAGLVLHFFAK